MRRRQGDVACSGVITYGTKRSDGCLSKWYNSKLARSASEVMAAGWVDVCALSSCGLSKHLHFVIWRLRGVLNICATYPASAGYSSRCAQDGYRRLYVVRLDLAYILAAIWIWLCGGCGEEACADKEGAAERAGETDGLTEQQRRHGGGPQRLRRVDHLRARGAYELLSFDLEERRERVDRDATPERDEEQEADVVAVDPVEKGVKLVRRCEGDGESDRERRLHAHLGRDQLERADTLAPVEETQVVDRVEHGSEHAEEVALRGDASRVGVLREECHARKRQANGCPNTRGDRHAGRPLRRWHDQRRQLDQKGAVARRCEREAV
mmetsp:Transcript_2249/g.4709  ORF Transcript_2249/g.4709 Transcript_2249/m.4709 type:complete len:324 (-) Transcript_2249:892-1863(-)